MHNRLDRIEEELKQAMPDAITQHWVDTVSEEHIPSADTEVFDRFCEPGRDLLRRGGKRWRPLMMVYTAEMLGGVQAAEAAYHLTPVVEFPHNGSLIIDDIEDDSDWRRGDRAVHLKYGTDVSINAGNLLYYLPTHLIDSAPVDDRIRLQIYQIYAKYLRRVHLGQGLDITWHNHPEIIPSLEEYEQMCRYKTGCLAGMSAQIGAAAASAAPEVILQAGITAEKIGVGFQIKDDVINLKTGNPGKKRGDDIVENKKSMPIIIYLRRFPERFSQVQEVFDIAREKGIEGAEREIESLISDLLSSGAVAEAEARSMSLLNEALEEIRVGHTPCEARAELLSMIERFIRS